MFGHDCLEMLHRQPLESPYCSPRPQAVLCCPALLRAGFFTCSKHVSKADEDSLQLLFWREKSSVVV